MDFFPLFEKKVKKAKFLSKEKEKEKYVYVRCNCQNIVKLYTLSKIRFEFILLCFFKCFLKRIVDGPRSTYPVL